MLHFFFLFVHWPRLSAEVMDLYKTIAWALHLSFVHEVYFPDILSSLQVGGFRV